ncbi:hypothetical protein [Thermovibrio ammonificans]
MFKNLVRSFPSLFGAEGKKSDGPLLLTQENRILGPIFGRVKKELSKFRDIKEVAVFSDTGLLVAKEPVSPKGAPLKVEKLSPLIYELHRLSADGQILSFVCLEGVRVFIKRFTKPNFYLVVVTGKQTPIGALVSYLNSLRIE